MSPEIPAPAGASCLLTFNFYEDWWSDTVIVGCAITYNNGNTWSSLWDLHATGNVGPSSVNQGIYVSGNFRIGLYYTGNSNNIDFWYVDNVMIQTALSPPMPPSLLQANASLTQQQVTLNWNSGIGFGVTGYYIERKNGLPNDTSSYINIGQTNSTTYTFIDGTVELNEIYTYRILTLSGPVSSHFGNEATAYVPEAVPVELQNFAANVENNNVMLSWITASEINNAGFEIERCQTSNVKGQTWEKIGFVSGNGTTTQTQFYSFTDENFSAGKYQYRLKQIDFDGSFEYSNTIEAEINSPTEFSLSQNYPNPFNPSTVISYQLAGGSQVTLKVFDLLGNEVATLVNEHKPAGSYEVEFQSAVGSKQLASGVYYYQLNAGNFIETKKMILLK
jgi:hypothetical protein